MAKKKGVKRTVEEKATMPSDAECLDGENDSRPETSIYAASRTQLRFNKDTEFAIPMPLLQKCTKLHVDNTWTPTARLDISWDIAHILVHFLFTDTYQCLRPEGSSTDERHIAEFSTSVQVYVLAREVGALDLEHLARDEMLRLGDGLRFATILDVAKGVYPNPGADDAWFKDYLKSGLESVVQDPSELLECTVPRATPDTFSIGDILFGALAELVGNKLAVPQPDHEPSQDDDDSSASTASKIKKKKKGTSGWLLEPEPEPELELEPEPVQEDDFWGFPRKSKEKKKSAAAPPPDLEPSPDEQDF